MRFGFHQRAEVVEDVQSHPAGAKGEGDGQGGVHKGHALGIAAEGHTLQLGHVDGARWQAMAGDFDRILAEVQAARRAPFPVIAKAGPAVDGARFTCAHRLGHLLPIAAFAHMVARAAGHQAQHGVGRNGVHGGFGQPQDFQGRFGLHPQPQRAPRVRFTGLVQGRHHFFARHALANDFFKAGQVRRTEAGMIAKVAEVVFHPQHARLGLGVMCPYGGEIFTPDRREQAGDAGSLFAVGFHHGLDARHGGGRHPATVFMAAGDPRIDGIGHADLFKRGFDFHQIGGVLRRDFRRRMAVEAFFRVHHHHHFVHAVAGQLRHHFGQQFVKTPGWQSAAQGVPSGGEAGGVHGKAESWSGIGT